MSLFKFFSCYFLLFIDVVSKILYVYDSIANTISELFGRQNITFPCDYRFKLNQRDLQIYDAFKGNNYVELSQKYKMTERGIRKVIDRVYKRMIKEKQPTLFDFNDA
ncbi:Mor transcription activator family protein [Gilliamella sp. Bif1-4]|jgi:Mor family transcriptional regulator|uniref:Mor transcription activator family protein n=1 Tax=Gilliamella sp. Bif1-4 TaxID=3120233 RepID=UPI0009C0A617|nr:Mor transcription activator family protein [Gilliamella apicola]